MATNHFVRVPEEIKDALERVEDKSAVFKNQLGVKDIVLAQILTLIGGYGIGTAAMMGSAHLRCGFWLSFCFLFL